MANFNIIDVALGDDIDKIVSDVLSETIHRDDEEIEQAIKDAQQKTLRNQPLTGKEVALNEIYNYLLTLDASIAAQDLYKMGNKHFNSPSGLISSLKTFIRKHKGNDYIIIKEDWGGNLFYRLRPYNAMPLPQPVSNQE